jgi:GT2 family glycosyltransferase
MQISCAVVCYRNSFQQVTRLLTSIRGSDCRNRFDLRVTLIDNSPNNDLASIARQFGAIYINLPDNPGFGKAHNLAIQHTLASTAKYHLILNPDVTFSSEVIPELVAYMDEHPDVGMIMPDIRYPDGQRQHLCKLLPSPVDLLMRRFLPRLYDRSGLLARYEMHHTGYDKIMEVPALSGCFMLVRTLTLRKVGGFDERFFMYLEDVDLSRRIGAVAKAIFFPHVSITHEYIKGSYKTRKLLIYHIKSAINYFNKWGWFFDNERRSFNRKALQKIESIKTQVNYNDARKLPKR